MADLATMGGIGQGLLAFSESYQRAKQQQATNDLNQQYVTLAKQREKSDLLSKGMNVDETGNPSYTPEMEDLRKTSLAGQTSEAKAKVAAQTPGSDESNTTYELYKKRLNDVTPGAGDALPQGKSDEFYNRQFGSYLPEQEKFKQQKDVANIQTDRLLQGLGIKGQLQKELAGNKNELLKEIQGLKNQGQIDKQNLANQGKSKKSNPAFGALDKDFAKDWNSYTNGGRATIDKTLNQLQEAKDYLQSHPDDTGAAKGLIPDRLRAFTNPDILAQKAKVQQAAVQGLKAALGGRVTQLEMQTFMNQAWDDKLPAQANIDRIDGVINRIQTERENTENKGSQFEKNGTLEGMSQSQPTGFVPKKAKGLLQPSAPTSASPAGGKSPPPGMSFDQFKAWKKANGG